MELHRQTEEQCQENTFPTPAAAESLTHSQQTALAEEDTEASRRTTALIAAAERQKDPRSLAILLFGTLTALHFGLSAATSGLFSSPLSNPAHIVVLVIAFRWYRRAYHRTTRALAQVDDRRMVGPLIDRLHSARKARRTRWVVRRALMRLLPRVQTSDAVWLTPRQKGRLVQHLERLTRYQQDAEFRIVILRALEQVGDSQAIPIVKRIVERQPRWPAQERVRAAALECLPFLLQRAHEENVRQTLLRPAGPVAESSTQLLRATQTMAEVDPRELLRAETAAPPE